jgi:uncharacterized oligopeptide transporter (OPT) family protein
MIFVLPVMMFAGLTLVAAWAWWCMARRPERWALWVDRENDFWRERGLISRSLAEKMKRWEKGWPLKWMAVVATCLGAIGVVFTTVILVKALMIEHQRIRMPYNPALHQKPFSPPKPKILLPPAAGKDAPKK